MGSICWRASSSDRWNGRSRRHRRAPRPWLLPSSSRGIRAFVEECVLALGFEQMQPGALKGAWDDRPSPMTRFAEVMTAHQGYEPAAPRAAQFFGGAGMDYMKQYGIRPDTFGRISVKARQHAARNPMAVFRQPLTLDEVMASAKVFDPLTRFQCCPPTCGAAAAVVDRGCAAPGGRAATRSTGRAGCSSASTVVELVALGRADQGVQALPQLAVLRLGGDLPSPLDPPPGCRFHPRCPSHVAGLCDAGVDVTAADGHHEVQLCEAILKSSAKRSWVSI